MKVTIIGAGNMGGAIARGLSQGSMIEPCNITCTAKSADTIQRLSAQHKQWCFSRDNRAAAASADIIILAVKPWFIEGVINEIRPSLDLSRQIIISVAASVTLEDLQRWLQLDGNRHAAIFKAIPNTAVEVMCGTTFIAAAGATQEQKEYVVEMFNQMGYATLVEESKIDAGMALASCGIAFAMRYIRAAAEGGVELGFYPKDAQKIAALTVKGAAELLLQSGNHAEAEIDKVTTPGGITIRGLNEMEHAGFTSAVIRGLKACLK